MQTAKTHFWSADWFTGLVFCGLFLLTAFVLARPFFYGIETSAYDLGMRVSDRQPNEEIAVIAIDEQSIANIGRWPWSRDIHAAVIDRLAAGGAKVIASTMLFSEPQVDAGLDEIKRLNDFLVSSTLGSAAQRASQSDDALLRDLAELRERLEQAGQMLDHDRLLAESIGAAGNVVLPIWFELGRSQGRPDNPLPDYLVRKHTLRDIEPGAAGPVPPLPARVMAPPIPLFGERAAALGHLNADLDLDGKWRYLPLAIQYQEELFPALALAVAAAQRNIPLGEVTVRLGEGIALDEEWIDTTAQLRMYNHFYSDRAGESAFPVDSLYDVFTGRIPVDKYRGKVVLIGADAAGIGDHLATPVASSLPPVLVLAHTVSNLLNGDFFTRPDWTLVAEAALFLVLVLYIILLLPRLRARVAAALSAGLVVSLIAAELYMLHMESVWLRLVLPAVLVLGGHLVMTIKRFGVTERLKMHSDAEGAESNKMLGLAFQGQGQLDMAFDKFRKCPLDAGMMDVLYNLALDYERKRHFNKAGAVYAHMAEFNRDYRDLRQRLKRSQSMEETVILGGRGSGNRLLLGEEGMPAPMLGRYVIEKELGKGAMGVVYLGRDPKINRVVAIKTIPLAEEFEEDDVDEAKDRFFREAETAGRLNHPDIVTVYDAGEEHDLAYIAMEYLEGEHLNRYTRSDSLLPPEEVLALIARTADALDYAHRQKVVHRDIKPANIMYNRERNELKITDFGIARITDSSRTKTGIVLGTPSYMSPEQLAGKTVTGSSDLFSLGVTLYQLLAGQLPFQADSMATLMYKIANDAPTPLLSVRPELPACIEATVMRALLKEPADRFPSGSNMASALRQCVTDTAA